ncbi:class I SAM-dependent DNA methyltransferase [Jannaschia seohaensis]|uniref:Methyltransferase domain-containing protein n=1 Tax=Jannaschia seohaensis TaxID=475081 RepID=A0A2Y9AM69_9RHOB|nr:methyltransferase domain-containing protein [Jannaschia seohaensis]PWJ20369.1 methyltransferase family protein [Jannaschia seohaensis]SSA44428.1 Methyltransferase domain-containing protein [Jannaschia seohaensis]
MSGSMPKGLWAPRPPEETRDLYSQWAGNYDADVLAAGYATPMRAAAALADHLEDRTAPVFDFGCGTGLSGAALAEAGFTTIDGTDVTPEMLEEARAKGVYRKLLPGTLGEVPDLTGHAAVTAVGVVSIGAAPAETLTALLDRMAPGALLAFSYNEATLAQADYQTALMEAQLAGHRILWAQHGPHLPEKEGARASTVYVLRRA